MLSKAQLRQLNSVFNPRSVAIVGASNEPGKVGHNVVKSIVAGGYGGEVYPVHRRIKNVLGLKVYSSLEQIPEQVDLVIICTSQYTILEVIDQCSLCGARGVISVAGGFREVGTEGRMLEEKLVTRARENGLLLVGPNTLGIINPAIKFNCTFFPQHPMPLSPGKVGLIAQSGGVGIALAYEAWAEGLGLSKWIGCGNRSMLGFYEYLQYLAADDETSVIGMFIEGTEDASELVKLGREIVRDKPIVVWKIGQTELANYASTTHTGSIAGSFEIYRDVFEQAGMILVDSAEELVAACKALAIAPLPQKRGIGIITHTAGPSIVMVDELVKRGMQIPALSKNVMVSIEKVVGANSPAVIKNPLDIPGAGYDAATYGLLAETVLQDEEIGTLISIYTYSSEWRYPNPEFIKLRSENDKPVIAYHVSPFKDEPERDWLQKNGIPVYTGMVNACWGAIALQKYSKLLQKIKEGQRDQDPDKVKLPSGWMQLRDNAVKLLKQNGRENLAETEAKEILAAWDVPCTMPHIVASAEEAVLMAEKIRYPVVMKILSDKIIHKSEVGGVKTGLNSPSAVCDAYNQLMKAAKKLDPGVKITVQEEVPAGTEIIVGLTTDPHFGRVLMFGLGGVLTELWRDVVFRVLPVDHSEAETMLSQIKGAKLLDGFRNFPRIDKEAVINLLVQISNLSLAWPELAEADLNPVIVYSEGIKVVDARFKILLKKDQIN